MMAFLRQRLGAAVLLCLIAGLTASPLNDDLTPQERRGKQIYLTGESPSGEPITAVLGAQGSEVPATILPCVTCHGRDGRGRPEGGVLPSNLTWDALTKPFGAKNPAGRQRPAYTEPRLRRAVTMGLDAAGNTLDDGMPRYQLTRRDLDDLVAYLKKLGTERDPGLTDNRLRVGVLLAPLTHFAARNETVQNLLLAYFDAVNRRGGLYRRQVELRFLTLPDAVTDRVAAVETFLAEDAPFALVAPFIGGAEAPLAALAAEFAVPFIGAESLDPPVGFPLNRQVFYLYSGLQHQAEALATFAGRRWTADDTTGRPPRVALLYADDPGREAAADAVFAHGERAGWAMIEHRRIDDASLDPAALAERLHGQAIDLVFWLGPAQQERALLAAADTAWTPTLYIPGALTGRDLFDVPPRFSGRVFLAFPTLPTDQTPSAQREYAALAAAYGLPEAPRPSAWSTLAAARLFTQAVVQAGQALSREKLIGELETFYDFETGATPPLTFSPNRRIGAQGAHILRLDLDPPQLAPAGPWIAVD